MVNVRYRVIAAALLFGLAHVEAATPNTSTSEVEVDIPRLGKVRGYKYLGNEVHPEGDVVVFKGIPYAQSPTGANRWKPPQPLQNGWTGVLDARIYESACYNVPTGGMSQDATSEEDCLYLNIWVPTEQLQKLESSTSQLPVHVFIHGGGFMVGSAANRATTPDPLEFVRLTNVVHVSFNYRLGPLGFMAHPGMSIGMPEVSPMYKMNRPWIDSDFRKFTDDYEDYFNGFSNNTLGGIFGLQDQILALRFVQQFIENFGGNRKQVTVTGNSAGAFSICLHLINPHARGLFQTVVMQSAMCDFNFVDRNEALRTSSRMATALGCSRRKHLQELSNKYGIHNWSQDVNSLDDIEATLRSDGSTSLSAFKAQVHLALRDELQCMKNETATKVTNAVTPRRAVTWWDGEMWFPIVNGFDLPAHPRHLLARGHILPNVTIVSGNVRDEATLFFSLGFPLYLSRSTLDLVLTSMHGVGPSKRVWEWYDHHGVHPRSIELGPPPDDQPSESCTLRNASVNSSSKSRRDDDMPGPNDISPAAAGSKIMSDLWHCANWRNTREIVWARALQTKASLGYVPEDWSSGLYVYNHAAVPSWMKWPMNHMGCYHGSDMIFFFHSLDIMNETEVKLSDDIVGIFRRFIYDESPAVPSTKEVWPPVAIPNCVKETINSLNVSSFETGAYYMPYDYNFLWPIDMIQFDHPHPRAERRLSIACTELWDDPVFQYSSDMSMNSTTITPRNTTMLGNFTFPLPPRISHVGTVKYPPPQKEPVISRFLNVHVMSLLISIKNGKTNVLLAISGVVLSALVWWQTRRRRQRLLSEASSKPKVE